MLENYSDHTEQPFMSVEEGLRPLHRMRQLAGEIRDALARNDMQVVMKAGALLAPTLENWNRNQERLQVTPGEAVQLAMDAQAALNGCEIAMREAMSKVSADLRRINQGKKLLAGARCGNSTARHNRLIDRSF